MYKKLRMAVLMGGNSSEYEISLISGREILANLPDKYTKGGAEEIVPARISKSIK